MDVTTVLSSGGIVSTVGGILYFVFNRRVSKLEDEKVNMELYEERCKNTDEKLDNLKQTTSSTHDAVVLIKGALGIND